MRNSALRNGDYSDRADVRFARPNIQIYDAHVVDLYQWVCARYLVGVKGAETKASAVKLGSRPISERITLAFQNPVPPRSNPGSTIEIRQFTLYFSRIWRRGGEHIPLIVNEGFN